MEHRALIIDDDKAIVDIISRVADECGYDVRTAVGDAVFTTYESFVPQVIILDVYMPDRDGLEIIQYLMQSGSEAQIIIISGSDEMARRMTESLGSAGGLNIIANLRKPFRVPELRALLEAAKRSTPKTARKTGSA